MNSLDTAPLNNDSPSILIVDDELLSLELLRNALSKSGFRVLTARNAAQALEIIARTDCRIVITDWEMPSMKGDALCREIRNTHQSNYVYVILLTSRQGARDAVEGLEAGADDFLSKPFNPAELVARVRVGQRILSLETRDLTILALCRLTESRSMETGAHIERVRCYSETLARSLASEPGFCDVITSSFVRLIYQTSPLHDIGKVAIPDAILLKPGSLDRDEFAVMKTHTTHGAITLQALCDQCPQELYLQMARDIAESHHERYDGKGYPSGLAGDDIPLAARIVAVADVLDALLSKRSYKEASSWEEARETIAAGSGSQFDPRVVSAFIRAESELRSRWMVTEPISAPATAGEDPRDAALMAPVGV